MLRGVHAKGAVLFLAIIILAFEGYFVYKYYGQYYSGGAASDATSREDTTSKDNAAGSAPRDTVGGTTVEEAPSKKTDGNVAVFVHRSTSENIVDNSTYIDHPDTNKDPKAILLVTQIQESDSEVTNSRPIGVWYDANRSGKWAVFNQDLSPMPEGATFSIVVTRSSPEVAVHRANSTNTTDNSTYLDHPIANDNPKAVLSITPNWNPGGLNGTYNDHLVGVRYDTEEKRWEILNQDFAKMPQNAGFNIFFSETNSSTG